VTPGTVVLLWIPVGAGGHVVVHTSRWWEALRARRAHRRPEPLFHAALELLLPEARYVVEMAPAWGAPARERGVVASGPVGWRPLGATRLFRYEVRCWPGGVIPDRAWAVGEPVVLALGVERVRSLRDDVARVPRLTWGADAVGVGDMWNSNSLVAWLLARAGVDAASLAPPAGSAPGWRAGLAAATDRLPG